MAKAPGNRSNAIALASFWIIGVPPLALLGWALPRYATGQHNLDQCTNRIIEGLPGFTGNTDAYGLGIRVGVYCQWAAQAIANFGFSSDTTRDMAKAVVAFDLAILIALLLLTFLDVCTFAVEVYILLFIFWGSYFVLVRNTKDDESTVNLVLATVLSKLGVESAKPRLRRLEAQREHRRVITFRKRLLATEGIAFLPVGAGLVATMALTAAAIYGMWFFIGQATMPGGDFPDTPGGGSFFLFGITRTANRKANSFLIALNAYMLLPMILILTVATCAILIDSDVCLHRRGGARSENSDQGDLRWREIAKQRRGGRKSTRKRLYMQIYVASVVALMSSVAMIYSLIAIELTLVWNNVSGVYDVASTGQAVALVVGVGSLMSVLLDVGKAMFKSNTEATGDKATSTEPAGQRSEGEEEQNARSLADAAV